MNSKYRIPALLLSLLLLCIPGIAEEAETAQPPMPAVEDIPAETGEPMPEAADAPIELPVIEAEVVSSAPAAEAVETDAPILPEPTLPPPEIQTDRIAGVASGSNYNRGYAKLTLPTTGYTSASPNADACIYLEHGVFFVSDRRASSSNDRLRVHFSDGKETRSVWVDERRLRPLSADEVLAFVSSSIGKSSIRLYGGDPMLPLDEPVYSSVITYSKSSQEEELTAPAMFINKTQFSMRIGDVLPIGVSFSDGMEHAVQFKSEDERIASVSGDGRITAITAGSTHVRVKSEFSNIAMIEILVQE